MMIERAVLVSVWAVVGGGVLWLLHYFIWSRLGAALGLNAAWRRRLGIAFWALGGAIVTAGFLARIKLPQPFMDVAYLLSFTAWLWLGFAFLLFASALVLIEIPKQALRVGRSHPKAMLKIDAERRGALFRLLGIAAATSGVATGFYSFFRASRAPVINHLRVWLPRLPGAANGVKIAQISDLHIGRTIGKTEVRQVVSLIQSQRPDLIAITGDLVDGTVEMMVDAVAPLASLEAPLGVFFVTGNHEYYTGEPDHWLDHLRTLGITVLRNERVSVGTGARSFDVAGIDDYSASRFAPHHGPHGDKIAAGRDVNRAMVLLAHQPRQIDMAQQMDADLMLSGHTHGGQLWPFGYLVKLVQPYLSGLHRRGNTQIYVSTGAGYWGPPMRLGAAAEIAVLELKAGSGADSGAPTSSS